MNAPRPIEWLTLEVVARDYGVAVEWILRVEAVGVLRVERTAGTVRIAASELDRLAAAMRWHLHFGMDLEVVAALLVEVDSV
jgi:hypothetical protein